MNALIFVVISVIVAVFSVSAEKIEHFVLVEINGANVCVALLVVVVKFAALAISLLLFLIGCHMLASLSVSIIAYGRKSVNAVREICCSTGQSV